MKKIFALTLSFFLLASSIFSVRATYIAEIDYLEVMKISAMTGDWENGQHAEHGRTAQIQNALSNEAIFTFEDLYLLSKIIYAEAGSSWLSVEWKMSVGEVLLNRVNSPEFPNTVAEVVYQPMQYYNVNSPYFRDLMPDELSVELAVRLLNGERVLNDNSVVFQANFPQGSATHTMYTDELLGNTYFCHSSNMYLYEIPLLG